MMSANIRTQTKYFLIPSYEIFNKDTQVNYFDGEENIQEKWKQLKNKEE